MHKALNPLQNLDGVHFVGRTAWKYPPIPNRYQHVKHVHKFASLSKGASICGNRKKENHRHGNSGTMCPRVGYVFRGVPLVSSKLGCKQTLHTTNIDTKLRKKKKLLGKKNNGLQVKTSLYKDGLHERAIWPNLRNKHLLQHSSPPFGV